MMSDLQKFIAEQLEDPKFRKAWAESRIEYEVARQLIQLRKSKGLTQEQLAEKVHTRQSEIARIENGNQNQIQIEHRENSSSSSVNRIV